LPLKKWLRDFAARWGDGYAEHPSRSAPCGSFAGTLLREGRRAARHRANPRLPMHSRSPAPHIRRQQLASSPEYDEGRRRCSRRDERTD